MQDIFFFLTIFFKIKYKQDKMAMWMTHLMLAEETF